MFPERRRGRLPTTVGLLTPQQYIAKLKLRLTELGEGVEGGGLADFPPLTLGMAEKLSEWCDPALRKVVMLAYCRYWEALTEPPPIQPPGGEEYEAAKLLLQVAISPIITGCSKCGWPRADNQRCYFCGDTNNERVG